MKAQIKKYVRIARLKQLIECGHIFLKLALVYGLLKMSKLIIVISNSN